MKSPYEITVRNLIPDLQLARELFPRLDQSLNDLTTRLISHAASWGSEIQSEIERMVAVFEAMKSKEEENTTISPEVEQLVSMCIDDRESLAENWVQEISDSGDRISDLVLIDKRSNTPVTHRDVGIGISQVIPILVSCYGLYDSLIAVEQPEIHLHPKLQAELGSVFAESIKQPYNNRFILETHSEHIMLRLQKLIREGQLTSEDISVIYVDCDHNGSSCLQLRLDEEGDFIDEWPDGFFEEDFNEIFG
jgi:AAA15 family ATPase/GTPase